MVPKGWEKRDLRNLITIKHGFAFKSEFFTEDGELVLLTPGSFYETGGFRNQLSKTKYYQGDVPDGYLLTKGDMLIAMTEQAEGLLGSALFVPESGRYLHNQRLGLVKITNEERVCLEFLYLYFNAPNSRKQITEQSTGTKVKHTSPDRLCSIVGLIPPLPEQKEIAEILSTWDQAISTTEQLLVNSQQQKKALMQQLLTGKKRLLDKNGVRFSGEWKHIKLANICSINPLKSPEPEDGAVSFVSMDSVSNDAKLLRTEKKQYADVSKGFTSFVNHDVLVAKITPCFENGKGAFVDGLINGIGFGSTEFHVLRAFKETSAEYLYHFTNTSEFRVRGEANMQGSAGQKRVTTDYLKGLKIYLPLQQEEQNKIAAVLSAADQKIETLQRKLDCLKQEKKALMQQLLTGKRRVILD